jgi:hypothetical protein
MQSQIYLFSTCKVENLVLPEISKEDESVIFEDERWYFLSKHRDFKDKRFFGFYEIYTHSKEKCPV